MWSLARGQRRRLAGGALLGLAQSAALLLVPWVAGSLAEAYVAGSAGSAPGLAAYAWVLLGLLALHGAAGFGSQYSIASAEVHIAGGLRERLYSRLQTLPLRWFDGRTHGDLLSIVAVDVEVAAGFASRAPASLLPAAVTALGALALMVRIDPRLALLAVLAVAFAQLAVRFLARPVASLSSQLAEAYGRLFALLDENLEHLRTIKAFSQEPAEAERNRAANRELGRIQDRRLRRELLVSPVSQVLAAGGLLGAIALAGRPSAGSVVAPGQLLSLLLYGLLLARTSSALAHLYVNAQQTRAALERLEAVWRERPEPRGDSTTALRGFRGEIEFRGVDFHYPGRPAALCGLDLRIEAGELVALVGPNGGGKTTIANLLVRFYEVDAGAVCIDGRDVRDIDLARLRGRVGLVPQRAELLQRSVRENIAFGRPGASFEQVQAAAWRAGVHEFVSALPDGYDTPIGERGGRLSGGQRQRIALARTLLTEPSILVLDEATSMFDGRGELDFLERNLAWLRRRTVILITHRTASLRFANRVLQIGSGRVVESALRRTLVVRERPSARPGVSFSPRGWLR